MPLEHRLSSSSVAHLDSNHVACANSAPPDSPPHTENGQLKRQQRTEKKKKVFNVQDSKGLNELLQIKLFGCAPGVPVI